ncbi:SSI family serine proteinase inhibitor [Streptomyces sp. NPDC059862]|uniref:SSI family serine proteinase inhibitor n=1 Tax=unclassified Streptomyces TaxID=2593676 RepID=UPI00363FA121
MLQVTPLTPTGPALRRLAIAAGASLAALTALAAAPAAAAASVGAPLGTPAAPSPAAPPPVPDRGRDGDRLTVTVRDAGGRADGTYELRCHPEGGGHPDVSGACRVLDRETRWGVGAFAPVPSDSVCTMQYGGPATAHVTGTWAGRPVDATFDRRNGCEIARWDRLVPLLPEVPSEAGPGGTA